MQTLVPAIAPVPFGHPLQVAYGSRRQDLLDAMRQCLGAVALLPRSKVTVL